MYLFIYVINIILLVLEIVYLQALLLDFHTISIKFLSIVILDSYICLRYI